MTYADFYNAQLAESGMFVDPADSSELIEVDLSSPGAPPRNEELSRSLAVELENFTASHVHPQSHLPDQTIILVLDTNVLLSNLPTLQTLFNRCSKCLEAAPLVFLIPLMTIRELDGLKMSDSMQVAKAAQTANKWLLTMLEEKANVVRAQRKGETPASLGHSNSVSTLGYLPICSCNSMNAIRMMI